MDGYNEFKIAQKKFMKTSYGLELFFCITFKVIEYRTAVEECERCHFSGFHMN